MIKNFIYSFGLLLINTYLSYAQTVVTETVTVDLGGRTFINKGLPFDEEFNISGKIDKNIERIVLKYQASDDTKVDNYFSDSNVKGEKVKQWDRVNANEDFVVGLIGPLRPNIEYKFTFTTYAKAIISDSQRSTLKEKIAEKLIEYLNKPDKLDNSVIESLYKELNILPSKVIGKAQNDITDKNGTMLNIKPFDEPLKIHSQKIIDIHNKLNDSKQNTNGILLDIPKRLSSLKDVISWANGDKVNGKQIDFSDDAKAILSLPVDESIQGIGKFTVKDGLKLVKNLTLNSVALDELLKGDLKIGSSGFLPSSEYDKNSIIFLASLLKAISSTSFSEKLVDGVKPIIRGDDSEIKSAIKALLDLNKARAETETTHSQIEGIKAFIPDFLENIYSSTAYIIIASPIIDVTSEKTPYISADVGFTGTYNFLTENGEQAGNNVYFLTHQAANIYFIPVNKKVPLKTFKPYYKFLKGFSIHIGVAQLIGNFNNKRFSGSLGDKSSIMFGAGYRINRVTKLALSCIFFNIKNINPTIENYKIRPFLSMNLSFDVNVAKGLQDVGKALKIF
jgi:hypothetical protein